MLFTVSFGAFAQKGSLLEKGIQSFEAGNKQEALNYFNQHLVKVPGSTAAYYNRAQLYFAMDSLILALEDLDYAEAVTRMNKEMMALEAAMGSFSKISGLSLFDYIRG